MPPSWRGLKGEMDAIEQAAIRKNCGIQCRQAPNWFAARKRTTPATSEKFPNLIDKHVGSRVRMPVAVGVLTLLDLGVSFYLR
jgi:hypothetical protein